MAEKERIAQGTLYKRLTEDFVEPAANFYVTDKNRENFYALWRQFKKTLAGYTRPKEKPEPNPTSLDELKVPPAEPVEDGVEAVRKILDEVAYNRIVSNGIIHEILKLCQPELKVLDWAKDHYWDSLEPQKDLIIKHLESYQQTFKEG